MHTGPITLAVTGGGSAPPTNGSREAVSESQGGVCGEDSEEVDRRSKEDSTSMSSLLASASVRCGAVRCGVGVDHRYSCMAVCHLPSI